MLRQGFAGHGRAKLSRRTRMKITGTLSERQRAVEGAVGRRDFQGKAVNDNSYSLHSKMPR